MTAARLSSRWTIYLASDLSMADRDRLGVGEVADDPLGFNEPLPDVDREGIEATLDGLYAELERLDQRTQVRLVSDGATAEARAGDWPFRSLRPFN